MAIFRSLSARVLLGIALLLALSFSLLTWIAQRESREAVLAAQGAAMDQLGQTLAQSVEDFLAQSRDAASLLAGLREIQALARGEWSDAAGADLAAALATIKAAEDVLVWNADGQVVASARQGRLQPGAISIADRDYFADTRQGKVHPGRTPVTSRVSGRRIVVVAAPVMEKGAALGGVGLAVDFQAFSERAILSVKVGRQGHVWLRDGQGRVLAHPQAGLVERDASAFPCGEMVRGQDGQGVCGGDGEARFQVWRTLSNGWTLVCAASLDEMGSAARSLRDLLLLLGAGAFAVTLGGLYLMKRHLVIKPLRTLTHFAGEVAAGNLSARLAGWRCCETSELAERLETMVRQLKERLAMSDGVLGGVAQSLPCVVADDQGRISFINQLMLDIVGRRETPEQCKGMTVPVMLYNDPTRTTRTDQALKTRQRVVGDFTMTNLHGQEYILNAQANPIIDEDGHCIGAFTFYYDLTERQRRQQAIETKNEALRALALEGGQAAEAVARAVERLTRQVEEASQGAAVQAQRMTDTATAMEEMNATTLEVARGAGQAADRAGKAMEAARRGQQVTLDMEASIGEVETQAARLLDIMRELGSHAEGIGQIITVIKDIADQTNLLALNAAIEAARAGDAGRGFAVVADEVRKLAEKTMHATTEVVAAIGAIQQGARTSMQATETASASIQTATSLAHRSGEALEAIVADMAETAGQVQAIAAASEEQSATSDEINHAVEEVNDLAARAAATMDEAGRAIHELSDQARAMETVTRQLTAQASAD